MGKKKVDDSLNDFLNVNDDDLVTQPFEDVIGERFGAYSKYIIQDRALPDLRDGLKPVQRRILFGMKEAGMVANSEYKKSARIVGDVMGKYHPHGDSSIYEAMVRMSQWWKNGVTFIDMHGNNGSMDDDPAAAMRYTEARLSQVAMEMLRDIDKNTVEMAYNFDDTLYEPTVLPARFPALLVNGSKGIASGFATEIPPHNLGEAIDAVIYRIKSPNARLDSILNILHGPDFPTGGIIFGKQGIIDAYTSGKGKIILRSKVEEINNNKQRQLVISEIPYEVIKKDLVKEIDEIRFNKEIWGISEIRDESDRNGLRIVIDIDDNVDSSVILNYLYKHSHLQISYNFNIVTIDNKRPRLTGILDILDSYIAHQKDVVFRRSEYDYNKAKNRMHIDEGLIKAISILDDVIAIIRSSKNKQDSKDNLMNKYGFSEKQAEAIVTLQLYRLSSTDILTLEEEIKSLKEQIDELNLIMSDENELNKVLIGELREIRDKFSYERKSKIEDEIEEIVIDKKQTIASEDFMLAFSRDGYAKRVTMKAYNSNIGAEVALKETDALVSITKANSLDNLLIFTSGGNFMSLPVYEIAEGKWKDEGTHLNKICSYDGNEKIISVIVINKYVKNAYISLVSSSGYIKRCRVEDFEVSRFSKAINCMKLDKGTTLAGACLTNGGSDLAVFYSSGNCVRYPENIVSVLGIKASGVISGSRSIQGHVIGLVSINDTDKRNIMLLTDKGGLKPIYPRYLTRSGRNTHGTLTFKSFKSDHHDAVGVISYLDDDMLTIITNTRHITLKASEVPYQAIDKIINKYLDIKKGELCQAIVSTFTQVLNDKYKTVEEKKETEVEFADFNTEDDDNEDKSSKYKNISIDDLFK